jgi:hypothetical protein
MRKYEEIKKEEFEKFINNASITELEGKTRDGYCWRLYKTAFDEENKIDLIFISHTYLRYKEYNFIPEKFEFGGAIHNRTGDILLSSYYLGELIKMTGSSSIVKHVGSLCNISEDVSKELTLRIKESWNKIKESAKNEIYYNDEHTKTYIALEKAEKWFVEQNLFSPPEYQYNIEINADENLLLEYYINKKKTLENLINEHFSNKKEEIYRSILCYEEACKILPTLLNDEGLKIEKAIKDALKDIDCNMVTVKATKETLDGRFTWEGKVELGSLKNCKSKHWIYLWRTPLPERKEFYNLFGKNVDLFPEDIDEIIFRKKTLYKKGE